MKLEHVTFHGPAIDDPDILEQLPASLVQLLRQLNGWIQFHGGFHLRGACVDPPWHSIRGAMEGPAAWHVLYPEVRASDVPFAEECLGDQFLLRDGTVVRLAAETGETEELNHSLADFLARVQDDPIEFLLLQPLLQFQSEGGVLEPGQSLASYPPFCMNQAADGVHLASVSTMERRRFLAHLAASLKDVPEGGTVKFEVVD